MSINMNNQLVLIFDVETTGLLPNKYEKVLSLDMYPYIIQLSFVVYHLGNHEIESRYNRYIKLPDDVCIPDDVVKMTGITNEKCKQEGVDIMNALISLHDAMNMVNVVVGHNIAFDKKMVGVEMKRNRDMICKAAPYCLRIFDKSYVKLMNITEYCTMKNSKMICSIVKIFKDISGNEKAYLKYPKLCELYSSLFEEDPPEGLHNAEVDVLVCLRCYLFIVHQTRIQQDNFMNWLNITNDQKIVITN